MVGAEKDVFELDHASVGEEQCLIAAGDQGRGWNKSVPLGYEEIDEFLADSRAAKSRFHARSLDYEV
jgi:hypothetical protein